jgi:hypothetical protein
MLKDVFLIGCSIENSKQLSLLSELVQSLVENKRDFILSSHTTIPDFLVSKSKGFVYLPSNPKYSPFDLDKFPIQTYGSDGGLKISSPYILKGSIDYFGVGNFKLIASGLQLAKSLEYDAVHWIDYDALPNYDEINSNSKLLETNPLVFYGNSTHFSVLIDSVKEEIFNQPVSKILEMLKRHEYSLSRFIMNDLVYGRIHIRDEFYVYNFMGRYDQVSTKTKIHWSLFKTSDSEKIGLFALNLSPLNLDIQIQCDGIYETITVDSQTWMWRFISQDPVKKLRIKLPDREQIVLDLEEKTTKEKYIESVKIEL